MLITLLVYLCVLAIIWWVLSTLPLPPPFRIVANVVLAIVAILLLLNLAGGGGGLGGFNLGHLGARC